jgi:hypothetical protein
MRLRSVLFDTKGNIMQVTLKRGVMARLSTRGTSVRKEHGPLIANALMHLVNDGCFVAIYPVLPLIAKEFHLSYTQVGFLKTALTGSSTALQFPWPCWPSALATSRFWPWAWPG